MRWNPVYLGMACLTLTAALTGCNNNGDAPVTPPPADGGHAHPTTGPHGGSLIELGNEEYHAELVHDETAGTVTIYVLDSAGKTAVAIDAPELTVNLKHDGQGEQFKLTPSPDSGDPAGKSSRFVSSDKELAEDLDREGADPELVITINGKQYRGEMGHEH